jgi:hypothetical protein
MAAVNFRFKTYFALLVALLLQPCIHAQGGPRLPCGTEAAPPYSGLDESPLVRVWSNSEFAKYWKPPECTGWTAVGFATLVTVAAQFRYDGASQDLLERFGAISKLKGMRYWSVTSKRWQTLILDAYALTGKQPNRGRGDFAINEMAVGSRLLYEQVDNRSGKATYRLQILEASADRITVEVENVSTIHYFLLPVFRPAELQSIYFLERESQGVWRYYGVVRTAIDANRLLIGNESSAINRAVAFYRHFVGIPTDQEPPAAR